MKKSFKKTILFTIIIITVITAGYFIGVGVMAMKRNYDTAKRKETNLAKVLDAMDNSIAIGTKLPDAILNDLDGNPIRLSEIACERSIIAFASPGCGFSEREMKSLGKIPAAVDIQTCFVMISHDFVEELQYQRQEWNLNCLILHDADNKYGKSLNVTISPLNIAVDRSLKIIDIIPGMITPDKIEEMLEK